MTKRLLAVACALVLGALAMPAYADVNVFADITKDKDINVHENVFIFKFPFVFVILFERLDGVAEATALVNQTNFWNRVDHDRDDIHLSASIDGSVKSNTGIVQVNQDVGNMVNQGNTVSVAVTSTNSWVNTQAEVDQKNFRNSVVETGKATSGIVDRSASITGSVNSNTGIVQVNQNAGMMNNQANTASVGVGQGAFVALTEAALGQVNANNDVKSINTLRLDTIKDSVNGNTGIVSVNQTTGNMNNQGVAVSVGLTAARAGL